jgi:hypothetical protein
MKVLGRWLSVTIEKNSVFSNPNHWGSEKFMFGKISDVCFVEQPELFPSHYSIEMIWTGLLCIIFYLIAIEWKKITIYLLISSKKLI